MLSAFIQRLLGSLNDWDSSDRRHNLRAPVDFALEVLFPTGRVIGSAVDLAPTGIRVRVRIDEDVEVKRGQLIQVKYLPARWKGVHTLECKTRWLKVVDEKYYVLGLLFADTPETLTRSWVPQVLAEALRGNAEIDRKQVRAHAAIETEFEWDGHMHTGRILDISTSGALLETDQKFDEGCHLDLTLKFGAPFEPVELEAVVCRQKTTQQGAQLGVAFIPGAKQKKFLQGLVKALISLQALSNSK